MIVDYDRRFAVWAEWRILHKIGFADGHLRSDVLNREEWLLNFLLRDRLLLQALYLRILHQHLLLFFFINLATSGLYFLIWLHLLKLL